ncbi:hypothetical protein OsJ_11891 [Oryza sativa Japonica Group]|uniref:Uncharacterized protein n=2 Tax=Oryza sativa subsp. japonica TaxID=39947 RepID=A0A8J8XJR7_ORYSJ|nr:hypothetical protein LOC_Os03g44410 [Oryza sativa Japonica Group]EAZ27929.1 hypothetical protein OsJ_11891 [Oryza sativa Japonica Group]
MGRQRRGFELITWLEEDSSKEHVGMPPPSLCCAEKKILEGVVAPLPAVVGASPTVVSEVVVGWRRHRHRQIRRQPRLPSTTVVSEVSPSSGGGGWRAANGDGAAVADGEQLMGMGWQQWRWRMASGGWGWGGGAGGWGWGWGGGGGEDQLSPTAS